MYLLALFKTVVVVLLARWAWNYILSPLKSFPGPGLASFTNLWRFLCVHQGQSQWVNLDLHRKHGTAVRMGPNVLSISDPSMIKRVFTSRNPWRKSDLYRVNEAMVGWKTITNIFATTDNDWHAKYIRPIRSFFSMTHVIGLEPTVDEMIDLLCKSLESRFARPGIPCDISQYVSYYAWDTMSHVTFSESLGLLESGRDEHGFLDISKKSVDYFAPVSQIPQLDRLFDKNPIIRIGPPSFTWATIFSLRKYKERLSSREKGTAGAKPDYLEKFIEVKDQHPELVDDTIMSSYLVSIVVAGSDTTAITICSALYHVLKDARIYQKLRNELDAASVSLPVPWKTIGDLPYLNAVMREAMRIHPGIGMMLERIVPPGGVVLPDGRFIPEGTIVGMNPWVLNRDEEAFGPDVDTFRPERWLQGPGESEEQFAARMTKMQQADLTFGFGSRICIGKQISQLESFKVIATLFAKFDMTLAQPQIPWATRNSWFVRQENIPVIIKCRD